MQGKMPAADDSEWNNSCSNIVCVRTKSSKESENNDDIPVISIQPTVVRSVFRNEASAPRPPPPPPRTTQRRRITRLIQTPTLTSPSPVHYESTSRFSINLKPSVTTSVYNGPDFSRLPFTSSRRSISVKRSSFEPKPYSYDLPEVTLPSLTTSGRSFRPVSLATPNIRSSSVPPISTSSSYLRRSSFSVPSSYYSSAAAYTSSGSTGRQSSGSVTSSPLRRGSVDVSYLSRLPDSYKSSYGYRPPPVPSPGIGSTYRRGSLSVLGTDSRPTYRSSIAGRLAEDEFKSGAFSSAPDAFSSLRSRTQQAHDKLNTHRSLIDRYLPGGGSRASSVDPRFAYQTDRNSELESFSRRGSLSILPRSSSVAGSRAPSLERHEPTPAPSRAPASAPPMPAMSAARRRIRSVLYKVSGDHEYLG